MRAMPGRSLPSVIVISSHVVRGSVGNRAAVFAFETLGFDVWAVPTVILPWHPGHGPAEKIVPEPEQFGHLLGELAHAPWLPEVGAILTGYLGDKSQAAHVAMLVAALRKLNPDALYLCDPVIGDIGGLYVPEWTAQAIRDTLLPLANIATPNRYELEWLSGETLDSPRHIEEIARSLVPETVLVTSVSGIMPNQTGNMLIENSKTLTATHEIVPDPPNGPGDLTSALFLAGILTGACPKAALQHTTSAVLDMLKAARDSNADELQLHSHADSLKNPVSTVMVENFDRG